MPNRPVSPLNTFVGLVSGVYGSCAAEYDTMPFTLANALPTERTSGPLPAGFTSSAATWSSERCSAQWLPPESIGPQVSFEPMPWSCGSKYDTPFTVTLPFGNMPRPRGKSSFEASGASGSRVLPVSAAASMGPFSTEGNQRFVMQPLFV